MKANSLDALAYVNGETEVSQPKIYFSVVEEQFRGIEQANNKLVTDDIEVLVLANLKQKINSRIKKYFDLFKASKADAGRFIKLAEHLNRFKMTFYNDNITSESIIETITELLRSHFFHIYHATTKQLFKINLIGISSITYGNGGYTITAYEGKEIHLKGSEEKEIWFKESLALADLNLMGLLGKTLSLEAYDSKLFGLRYIMDWKPELWKSYRDVKVWFIMHGRLGKPYNRLIIQALGIIWLFNEEIQNAILTNCEFEHSYNDDVMTWPEKFFDLTIGNGYNTQLSYSIVNDDKGVMSSSESFNNKALDNEIGISSPLTSNKLSTGHESVGKNTVKMPNELIIDDGPDSSKEFNSLRDEKVYTSEVSNKIMADKLKANGKLINNDNNN
jgi:hypothetical protein